MGVPDYLSAPGCIRTTVTSTVYESTIQDGCDLFSEVVRLPYGKLYREYDYPVLRPMSREHT
jgi:hypothetical protein